jgi:hypothetical protein
MLEFIALLASTAVGFYAGYRSGYRNGFDDGVKQASELLK